MGNLAQALVELAVSICDRRAAIEVRWRSERGCRGSEVEAMLGTARALIVEADAVDLALASSDSPEAVVRRRWTGQRT